MELKNNAGKELIVEANRVCLWLEKAGYSTKCEELKIATEKAEKENFKTKEQLWIQFQGTGVSRAVFDVLYNNA